MKPYNPTQLSLLDQFSITETLKDSFWLKFHNWIPEVGKKATLNITAAFSTTLNERGYCYCMRVEIISIEHDIVHVRTTKCWEDACKKANSLSKINQAGNVWKVNLQDLSPIL